MNKLYLTTLAVLFFIFNLGAQIPTSLPELSGWTGSYTGDIDGTPSTLTLQQNNMALSGTINASGYYYSIQGTVSGSTSQGQIVDSQTQGSMEYRASLEAHGVNFILTTVDPYTLVSQQFQYQFTRKGASNNIKQPTTTASASATEASFERDQRLVGYWTYSSSYFSGDFSATTEYQMQINPDGTYLYGDGRIMGGSAGASFDSGGGGDMTPGKWRTQNSVIYLNEGYGWEPYAGYYIEGNSLLLKFDDGSKQLWNR